MLVYSMSQPVSKDERMCETKEAEWGGWERQWGKGIGDKDWGGEGAGGDPVSVCLVSFIDCLFDVQVYLLHVSMCPIHEKPDIEV